jgi:hypothetical protein
MADHIHQGIGCAGISGGNTSNTSGTYYGSLMLAGGNLVTLSGATGVGGQTITISAGNTASTFIGGAGSLGNTVGQTGLVSQQLYLVGTSNITLSQATNAQSATVSLIAAFPGIIGMAATPATTYSSGTIYLSDYTNITISTSVNGISQYFKFSCAPHAGIKYFQNFDDGANSTIPYNQGSFSFQRVIIPANLTATCAEYLMHISGGNSYGLTISNYLALYAAVNPTSWTTINSTSGSIAFNSTLGGIYSYTNYSGTRYRPYLTMAAWSITPGDYLLGFCLSSTTGATGCTLTLYGNSRLSLSPAVGGAADYTYIVDRGYYNGATSMATCLSNGSITQSGASANAQPWIRMMS